MPKDKPAHQPLKITFWLLKLVFKIIPKLLVVSLITQIVTSILPFVQSRILSNFIDDLFDLTKNGSTAWINTFIIFSLVLIFTSIFDSLRSLINRTVTITLTTELRKYYLKKLSSFDIQHLENRETANLTSKVSEEYSWRINSLLDQITALTANLIGFSTAIYILFPRYPLLIILSLLGQIPNYLVDKKYAIKNYRLFDSFSERNRLSWDVTWQLTDRNYLRELKINHAISFLYRKFTNIIDPFTNARNKQRKEYFLPNILTNTLSNLTLLFCIIFIIKDIQTGIITVGLFTFYLNAIRQNRDLFGNLFNTWTSISEQSFHIENFRKVMELDNLIKNGSIKTGLKTPLTIEFRNVSFRYPNTEKFIFKDLNLLIQPEEEIALVGVNGAGKTTLIKLLCRFYDPTVGDIFINNQNLKDLDTSYWYRHLSLLSQEFNTYSNLTLKENVYISHPQKINTKKVIEALKLSEAYNFAKEYKMGLNTPMSQRYGGEEPSWGQWQKIAISRIFYRNTPLMILDEPTASIDANSEFKIFSHLYQKIHHKTVIIVSHRFSTVRKAGRIIVIDKGKVIEEGSHEKLLKLNGFYAKSFHLQAQGYNENIVK
jgi:ABC-type multidrug transport system fused ATPase/permease subunit